MRRWMCFMVLAAGVLAPTASAQTGDRITGTVTSASDPSVPIAGAIVTVLGTSRRAVTDGSGRFTITDVPVGSRQVQARAIGYSSVTSPVTINAGEIASLSFQLIGAPTQLEGVVVVGYGTQSARTVTGAVSTVAAEKLKDIPTNDPMKALQGKVAGVEIVSTSNEPGAAMQVRIRGIRSMASTRNEPLFVVDGIPITGGIDEFSPQIIESIEVLKDAAATAIYGSRGSNGVILVTTKKGLMDGKMHSTFNVDSYFGTQQPVKIMQMMDMQQFTKFLQDVAAAAGQDTSLAAVLAGNTSVPGTGISKRLYAYQNNIQTDWQRAVLRNGRQRNVQGGFTGSNADTRYSLSGNYFGQEGLIPGQGNTRGSAFASIDHTASRFRVGISTNISRALVELGEGAGAFGYAAAMTPFGSPYNYTNPDSAGLLDFRPDDDQLNINPVLEARSMIRQQTNNRVFASAYGELKLTEGLRYRANFGPDYASTSLGCYNDPWTHGPCSSPGTVGGNQGQPPQAMLRNTTDFAYTLDNLLLFTRDLGTKSHIDATALYSIQHDRFTNDSLYASQLPYNTQLWYDLGSGTAGNNLSSISEWALRSYMGRVNYTLVDRYSLSLTGRSDGSSRLAPGHKWAFFPSVGLSWQLGDESFMRRFSAFTQLKVRGSYGTTGNTSINPYQTQGTLSPKLYTFGTSRVRGYQPGTIPNPDLSWERTDQTDFGIDFGLFNNRLTGTLDKYRQNTRDLLLVRQLPATSGFTQTLQNIGSTRNTGFEVGLSTVNVENWHGFRWSSDVAWSTNKNVITSLQSGATSDISNLWFVGHPINLCLTGAACPDPQRRVFYDWQYLGIWQIADSLAMRAFNANGSTFKPGDPRVADVNGDGKIDANDRTFIGDSYPRWVGSFSNRIQRGGFDVSALITAKVGYTFIDGTPRSYENRNGVIADTDYWTPTNPTNRNPAPSVAGNPKLYATTRLYTSGTHWRIRNITAGYTFGPQLAGRLGAESVRIYGTAQDPYIHTSYNGPDPEVGGNLPTVRTLLVGTNISW